MEFGLGFTNIVHRMTPQAAHLQASEFELGAKRIQWNLMKYRPKIICFIGRKVYQEYMKVTTGIKLAKVTDGLQTEAFLKLEDGIIVRYFVLPSTSGRFPMSRHDRIQLFQQLKQCLDQQ